MSDVATVVHQTNFVEKRRLYQWDAAIWQCPINLTTGVASRPKYIQYVISKFHQLVSKYTKNIELYCAIHVFQ